jgi:hypothetical protein
VWHGVLLGSPCNSTSAWRRRAAEPTPCHTSLVEADIDLDGTILHCPEGVSVFPDGHPVAPRLPLLGLRAVARNKIKIVIDGMDVTVG